MSDQVQIAVFVVSSLVELVALVRLVSVCCVVNDLAAALIGRLILDACLVAVATFYKLALLVYLLSFQFLMLTCL